MEASRFQQFAEHAIGDALRLIDDDPLAHDASAHDDKRHGLAGGDERVPLRLGKAQHYPVAEEASILPLKNKAG